MLVHGEESRAPDVGPRYRLQEFLGSADHGDVYEAIEASSGQRVALNVLTRMKPGALSQLKRDFHALAALRHPSLVGLRELYEQAGCWVLVRDLAEGTDLLTWVRSLAVRGDYSGFDEGRLRIAFSQIAQGLIALHEHDLLHRALKPANVRVTHEGQAVLLDYGLASQDDARSAQRGSNDALAYAAPELVAGEAIGPAADWYAFGACLYEALTGALPFANASPSALLLKRLREKPTAPGDRCAGVPPELDWLCMRLLERAPEARFGADGVLSVLAGEAPPEAQPSDTPFGASSAEAPSWLFAGRSVELDVLARALAKTNEGVLSVVIVDGESGIGKSALVRETVRRELSRSPETLVLAGRCYEHERVPYKAFDGCVDALARVLSKMPREDCAALLPRHAGLLLELFPTLRGVKAIASATSHGAPAAPAARRLEAFQVLSELLGKLAESRQVVLVIDDLQWADQESFRLLRALIEDRPPPLLIACTVRPRAELTAEIRRALDQLRSSPAVTWIELRGLGAEHTEAFARYLLGSQAPSAAVTQIARESGGHPMLIAELARYARSNGLKSDENFTLDAAISARIAALTPLARRLLEAVALSGKPHSARIFERIVSSPGRFDDALHELLHERLIRRGGATELTPYHDRIRTTTVARLTPELVSDLHRELATELSASEESDASELAFHWDRAGDRSRAVKEYVRAGHQAFESLAFAPAAELYGRALELRGDLTERERAELLIQRAHALARGGRSADAAILYLQAAEQAQDDKRIQLRVLAAQHQIQSVQISDGLANAQAILDELGMPLPRGTASALGRIVWERALLSMRGYAVADASTKVNVKRMRALDALSRLVLPVTWAQFLPGNALNVCHVRPALNLGEPGHAARALSQEAAFVTMFGNVDRATELFEQSWAIVTKLGDPAVEAYVRFFRGSATVVRGLCRDSLRDFEAAQELLVTSCPDEPWLLTNVRMSLGVALDQLGEYRRSAQQSRRWLAEVQDRGDIFAQAALLGVGRGFYEALMRDEPDAARGALDAAMAPWPRLPVGFAHAGEVTARSVISAYLGSPVAHTFLTERRGELDRAVLFRASTFRDSLLSDRCRAALAAYELTPQDDRRELLSWVEAQQRGISRARSAWGGPFRGLITAQLRVLQGSLDEARCALREVHHAYLELGMPGYAQNAAYLLGLVEGGEGGQALRRAALEFFREQGWKDPWRAATMHAPAARMLEGESATARVREPLLHNRYRLTHLDPTRADLFREALDTRTGRLVTLRSLVGSNPDTLLRFKQEFRALAGVHHENLPRLEGLFEAGGEWSMVMEQVPQTDLLSFVRVDEELHEGRLCVALRGLLAGAAALHDAGFIHRDIQPKHVRVAETGRVLLIGGGLLTPVDAEGRVTTQANVLDNLIYAAPERLAGSELTAAADMYAVGVCLYQALTGQLPFQQMSAAQLIDAKQRGGVVLPGHSSGAVPSYLEELCVTALAPDPRQRPTFEEAKRRIDDQLDAGQASPAHHAHVLAARGSTPQAKRAKDEHAAHFVGRRAELDGLTKIISAALHGATTLLLVQGESGMGKTALVHETLEGLGAEFPRARVVRSRCYGNEQVAYQAFDGAVDELARALRKMPRAEVEALLPPRAALLAQLFPIFGSVRAIADATKKGLPAEPTVRRKAALDAFVRFLAALSQSTPLVIAIDDLQWADAESFQLLRALLADAREARIALVATLRPGEARDELVSRELKSVARSERAHELLLGALSHADARALAASLLRDEVSEEQIDAIAREGAGHPLFLRELANFFSEAQGLAQGFDLTRAITARLDRLPRGSRRLLELIAISAGPCPSEVLSRAYGAELDFDQALRVLLAQELVRARAEQGLVCFHDRIRDVTARLVPAERLPELFACLAEALDAAPGADAGERARLWDRAGQAGRAIAAYADAGKAALSTLAFGNAEKLYGRAVELKGGLADAERATLLAQRAHALVGLGHSAEAARLFALAAERSTGAERVRLKIWAAQHQIQSAELEAGTESACAVLRELGVPFPRGTARSLARIAWERMRVAVRSYDVTPRMNVKVEERLALDAMSALIFPLTWADLLAGNALNTYHLRRALDLGDPGHAARALGQEAAFRGLRGDFEASGTLLDHSADHAARAGDPAVSAYVLLMKGSVAVFQGKLPTALQDFEEAEELLVTSCPGEAWLLTNVRMTLGVALYQVGEHRRFAEDTSRWLAEAEARQDAFARAALLGLGHGFLPMLMRDAPADVLTALASSMKAWSMRPFGFAHHGEVKARSEISAYAGNAQAWQWLVAHEKAHDRAFMHNAGPFRDALFGSRCMAGFAALASLGVHERRGVLRAITGYVRSISQAGNAWGAPFAELMTAQLHALEGRRDLALSCAARARQAYEGLDMLTFMHSAAYLEGVLQGGADHERCQAAVAFFADQGWSKPERAVTMLVPSVRVLS